MTIEPPTEKENNGLISSREAVELTGYTKQHIAQLCRAGMVDAQMLDGQWFINKEHLLNFAKDQLAQKGYVSVSDAAESAGYTKQHTAHLAREGFIESSKLGDALFVKKKSLDAFVIGQRARDEVRARELAEARKREYQETAQKKNSTTVSPSPTASPFTNAFLGPVKYGLTLVIVFGFLASGALALSSAEYSLAKLLRGAGVVTKSVSTPQSIVRVFQQPVQTLSDISNFFAVLMRPIEPTPRLGMSLRPREEVVRAPESTPAQPTTVVQNIGTQYVTNNFTMPVTQTGVSTDTLDEKISTAQNALRSELYQSINRIASNTVGNYRAISLTNAIHQLSGVTISNSTFQGSSVNATSGQFTDLSATNANLGTLVASSLNVSGSITTPGLLSYGLIEAPRFTATSTTEESIFPRLITTYATSTNLTTTFLTATTSSLINLTGVNATTTNATSTNLYSSFAQLDNLSAGTTTITGPLSATSLTLTGALTGPYFTATSSDIASVFPRFTSSFGTTTNATSTNFYSNRISGVFGDIINLVVTNATTTNATTTNLAVTGAVTTDLVPHTNNTYNLGSPANFWNNGYINELTVNNLSAASTTISGTVSNAFTINSDNATNDTEDMSLIFYRGIATPNAVLSWDSTNKYFNFNRNVFVPNTFFASTTVITDATITNATSTNLFATNFTATNGTITNASTTALSAETLAVGGTATTTISADGTITTPRITATNASTTNISSTYASSTSAFFGSLSVGSLTGVLKATAGAVTAGLVDLATEVSGILSVAFGGTGWGNIQENTLLLGNGTNRLATTTAGTNGQVLSLVNGVPSWVATTTAGTGLTYDGTSFNLDTTGDWTGTFDGQEGTYYLNAINLTNFGTPFYQFFSATTTDALAEGSNLYFTDARARNALSSTATGLTYTAGTGVFSLTSGYNIPLTASTTNWNTFYDTPSNRITAGTGLSWAGNTLNAEVQTGDLHDAVTLAGENYLSLSGQQITANAINLASSNVTGTLPVANGGTGATTFTNNRLLTGNGTSAIVDEANLTFDGSLLTVTGNASTTQLTTTGATYLATMGGNVGVGTTTTSGSRLRVAQGADDQGVQIDGYDDSSNHNLKLYVRGDGNSRIDASRSLYLFSAAGSNGGSIGSGASGALAWDAFNRFTFSAQTSARVPITVAGISGQTASLLDITSFGGSAGDLFTVKPSGNIGVGTTSPQGRLHVYNGASNASVNSLANDFIIEDDNYAGLSLLTPDSTGVGSIYFGHNNDSDAGRIVYNNNDDSFDFFTAGSQKIKITTAGNVGIGTTAPTQKLEVSGNIRTSAGSGGTLTLFESDGTRANQTIVGADSSGAYITGTYNTGGSSDIRFINASTEAMRIKSGNVGIGTTSPGTKLDVYGGTLRLSSSNSTYYTDFINAIDSNNAFRIQHNGNDVLHTTGDAYSAITLGNSTSKFVVSPANSNAYFTGNVGIGTTAPGYKLDIQGVDGTTALGVRGSDTGLKFDVLPIAGDFGVYIRGFDDSGVETIRLASDGDASSSFINAGNVGIGTTSPSEKLHVQESSGDGPVAVFENNASTGATAGSILLKSSGAAARGAGIYTYNTASPYIWYTGNPYNADAFAINRRTSATAFNEDAANTGDADVANLFYIKSDGNVGIGTTSPSSSFAKTLQVEGSSAALTLAETDRKYSLGTNAAGNYLGIYDETDGAYRMVWDDDGNVGIGTASPGYKLDIDEISAGAVLRMRGGPSSAYYSRFDVDDTGFKITSQSNSRPIIFQTGSTPAEKMRITNNGNVGIGTTEPIARLSLGAGTANHPSTKIAYYQFGNNIYGHGLAYNGSIFGVGTYSNVDVSSGVPQMWVGNNGNVGIGTTGPGSKLSVSGGTSIGSSYAGTAAPSNGAIIQGNVGIGTTAPGNKLEVNADSGSATPGIRTYTYGHSADVTSFSARPGLELIAYQSDAGSPYMKTSALVANSDGTVPSELQFWTKTSGQSSPAERLRITSTGNVGIGTTGPTTALHVYNTSDWPIIVESSDSFSGLYLKDTSTTAFLGPAAVGDNLRFRTQNTDRMSITSTGNVGIGTTAPAEKLQIGDGSADENVRVGRWAYLGHTSGGFATVLGNNVKAADNQPEVGETRNAEAAHALDIGYSTGFRFMGKAAPVTAGDTLSELVRITTAGNVGIGTTGPGSKLSVSGGTSIGSSYAGTAAPSNGAIIQGNVGIGTTSPSTILSVQSVTNPEFRLQKTGNEYWDIGAGTNELFVQANDSTLFTILDSGNVGIGTTTPWAQLSVEGQGGKPSFVVSDTSNNTDFIVTEAGNVGVGTTSPYANFSVGNPNSFAAFNDIQTRFESTGTSAISDFIIVDKDNSNTRAALQVQGNGGATEVLFASSGGNVGIGTTAPGSKLEVLSSGNLGIDPTAASSQLLKLTNVTADVVNEAWGIGFNTSQSGDNLGAYISALGNFTSNFNTSLVFATRGTAGGATERVRINHDGNVGIGTTSPDTLLHLESTDPRITLTDTTLAGAASHVIRGADQFLLISADDGNDQTTSSLRFNVDGSEAVRIDSSGNVGIGTTAPGAKLDISDGTPTIRLTDSDAANYHAEINGASTRLTYNSDVNNIGVGEHRFQIAGSDVMRILTNGNVGIGTTSPSELLHVDGAATFGANATRLTTYSDSTYSGIYNGTSIISDESIYMGSGATFFYNEGAESVRITTSGNVGIGTTGPGSKLSVSGGGTFGSGYAATAAPTGGLIIEGNVGIGTTSPLAKLDVYGDAILSGSNRYLNFGAVSGSTGYGIRDNAGTIEIKSSGGAWASVGGGGVSDGDKGDITVSGSGSTWSIDAGAVSDAEIDYSTVTLSDFTNDAGYGSGSMSSWSLYVNNAFGDSITNSELLDFNSGTGVDVSWDGSDDLSFSFDCSDVAGTALSCSGEVLSVVGSSVTGISASNISSGTLPSARLSGTYSSALTFSSASNSFTGSGAGLTSLNASNISSGTLNNSRLPSSISVSSLAGSGSGITSLNASNLSSGTLPSARLSGTYSSAVSFSNNSNSFFGGAFYIGSGPNSVLTRSGSTLILSQSNLTYDTSVRVLSSAVLLYANGGNRLTANSSGGALFGTWDTSSDRSIKDDIEDLTTAEALDIIANLRPRQYRNMISDRHEWGFVAQEVQEFAPWLVSEIQSSDTETILGLNYTALISPLVQATQELHTRTSSLTTLNGNIGIGTSTPSYKLHVLGDVAATSFVNISTREAKKDIFALSDEQKAQAVEILKAMEVVEYRYNYEDGDAPLRRGLIAEDAPSEVLAVSGKGIDLYKLVTVMISAVQELITAVAENGEKLATLFSRDAAKDAQIAALEARLSALEAQLANTSGQAGQQESTDTTAPTITINGNTTPTITINTAYADLGATVTDNKDTNLGITTEVRILATDTASTTEWTTIQTVTLDTSTPNTFEIRYSATDTSGNTASATRVVTVQEAQEEAQTEPTPEPEPTPDPEPTPEPEPEVIEEVPVIEEPALETEASVTEEEVATSTPQTTP